MHLTINLVIFKIPSRLHHFKTKVPVIVNNLIYFVGKNKFASVCSAVIFRTVEGDNIFLITSQIAGVTSLSYIARIIAGHHLIRDLINKC